MGGKKLFNPEVDPPVTQVSAEITTESLQPLCGENQQLKLPYETVSAVFVNGGIIYESVPFWAEMGYMRRRSTNTTLIEQGVFFELVSGAGEQYTDFDIDATLLESGNHRYSVLHYNPLFGTWYYLVDGVVHRSFTDDVWIILRAWDIAWQGEVTHTEDKLAGEPDSHCHFTHCWYETDWNSSNVHAADFAPADIVYYPPASGHPGSAEWGKQFIDVRSFDIWDKYP